MKKDIFKYNEVCCNDQQLNSFDNSNYYNYNPFIFKLIEIIKQKLNIFPTSYATIDENITQNKNYFINTETTSYFAKIYTSGSIRERIFEASVLKKLRDSDNLFVMKVITEIPLLINDTPVMLFETIQGESLKDCKLSNKNLFAISSQLAQMHNTLKDFNPGEKIRFDAFGFDFVSYFKLDPNDKIINKSLNYLKNIFANVNKSELISTIIHDDLSPSNIIKTVDDSVYFIDFDDAHRSYRISDIGMAIKEFIIQPMKKINYDVIIEFLKNYESVENTPKLSKYEKYLVIPMALHRALFMYFYYKMVENKKNISLQSKDEYNVINLIIKSKGII